MTACSTLRLTVLVRALANCDLTVLHIAWSSNKDVSIDVSSYLKYGAISSSLCTMAFSIENNRVGLCNMLISQCKKTKATCCDLYPTL